MVHRPTGTSRDGVIDMHAGKLQEQLWVVAKTTLLPLTKAALAGGGQKKTGSDIS
jgi:hypothetical protein